MDKRTHKTLVLLHIRLYSTWGERDLRIYSDPYILSSPVAFACSNMTFKGMSIFWVWLIFALPIPACKLLRWELASYTHALACIFPRSSPNLLSYGKLYTIYVFLGKFSFSLPSCNTFGLSMLNITNRCCSNTGKRSNKRQTESHGCMRGKLLVNDTVYIYTTYL